MRDRLPTPVLLGFPCGSAANLDSIPGLGRSPGEGKGQPLQYSGLENSIDCTVREVGLYKESDMTEQLHFSGETREP